MDRSRSLALLTGALLWASIATLAALGPSRGSLLVSTLAYTAGFLTLARLWTSHRELLDDPRILLGGAVLLRLTLLPTLPDLSDDLYRYVWDGWLTVSGINPFRYVPSDPALSAFQDSELFRSLNSPEYHSIYPPLSQLVFLIGGATYRVMGWPAAAYVIKAGFLALEISGIYFLHRALCSLGRKPGALALYALNPLVLVTLAGGGHTEGGLVFGLGLLAWGVASGRRVDGWLGLALATASKGIPILLAPLLFRRDAKALGTGRAVIAALPAGILGLLLLAPFYFPGLVETLASSADLYVRSFEFNAGVYALLEGGVGLVTGQDWGRVIGPLLRWIFLAATLAVWLRWPVDRPERFFRASLVILGLYLVTATTVHPWYLVWGLALVPLTPFLRGAWLWASWAAFLTYSFYVGVPGGALAALFWGGTALAILSEFERPLRQSLLRIAGWRKARQIRPYVDPESLLDLGAGEGYVAWALASRGGARPILVDVGAFFLVPLPGVVYDGRRLPFADNAFDSVLISLTLHHASDPDAVISDAIRIARRRLIVTESTYRFGWEHSLLEVTDRWANRTRGMAGHAVGGETLHFRTVAEWECIFRREGAEILRSERLNRAGHRHHLFVLEPARRDAGVETPGQNSPKPL